MVLGRFWTVLPPSVGPSQIVVSAPASAEATVQSTRLSSESAANTPSPSQASPRAGVLTARVVDGQGFRYGFFTPKGYLVTAPSGDLRTDHAVVAVWQEDGRDRREDATVVRQCPFARQVTLLRLSGADPPKTAFATRTSRSLRPGDEVKLFLSQDHRNPGSVLAVGVDRSIPDMRNLLATTSIGEPGTAGAPVLDSQGRVVAVYLARGSDEALSIPIEDFQLPCFADEW